jgi:cobalt/nickel transport system permease protein
MRCWLYVKRNYLLYLKKPVPSAKMWGIVLRESGFVAGNSRYTKVRVKPMNNKTQFLERSLMSVLLFLKDTVSAEENASQAGFLQSIDPRMKVVSFAIFFLTAIFLKKVDLLLELYVVCLVLVFLSKINLGFFLKRTCLFIPLFSLFIAIPSIFSIVSPGVPIITMHVSSVYLSITLEGLQAAAFFVLRVLVCVSYAVLLSLTTKHTVLLRVLRILRIPQIFIMTLGMCYRYVYLFVEMIEHAYIAIKSRTQGITHYKKGQRIVAWNIAYVWQRSFSLSQQVYSAMLSRGYSGEPVLRDAFRMRLTDWVWICMVTVLSVSFLLMNNRLL